MTSNKFKSDILESVHASAVALLKVGAIDKQTMRQLDERCLVSVPILNAQQNQSTKNRQHG